MSIQLEKAQGDAYEVMGRGELQLAILVENMRREGEREEREGEGERERERERERYVCALKESLYSDDE